MSPNPVMQRIGRLTRSWRSFTEMPEARALRWCLTSDSGRLLDGFIAWHSEEESELSDAFLVFPVPFEDPARYASQLLIHFCDELEQADKDFEAMGLPTGWRPVQPASVLDAEQEMIAALAAFQLQYAGLAEHVVMVLMPPSIADMKAWKMWLERMIRVSYWPSTVRLLIADWLPELQLSEWAQHNDRHVVSHRPVLDMVGLPLELLAHLPGSGPGFELRRLFVMIGQAAGLGQLAQVKLFAQQALAISNANGWQALGSTIEMMVAGAFLSASKSDEAIDAYRRARDLATLAQAADASQGKTLVTANLALSSGLVGQGKFEEARKYYYEAATLADQSEDLFAAFESRRMASYCGEQLGDYQSALRDGQAAMRMLESVASNERLQSTAPHLAMRLTEMSGRPELAKQAQAIRQLCDQTLAGDWKSVALASTRSVR